MAFMQLNNGVPTKSTKTASTWKVRSSADSISEPYTPSMKDFAKAFVYPTLQEGLYQIVKNPAQTGGNPTLWLAKWLYAKDSSPQEPAEKPLGKPMGGTVVSLSDVMKAEIVSGSDLGETLANLEKKHQIIPGAVALQVLKKGVAGKPAPYFLSSFPRSVDAGTLMKEMGGSLLRMEDILKDEIGSGSELGAKILAISSKGKILPMPVVVELLQKATAQQSGPCFVGNFPRSMEPYLTTFQPNLAVAAAAPSIYVPVPSSSCCSIAKLSMPNAGPDEVSSFLRSNIQPIVSEGMVAVFEASPQAPIRFLAEFLEVAAS